MTVRYHPGDEVLLSYVTGGFPFPLEVVMACHLTLCPECCRRVFELEAIGGVMLQSLEGTALAAGSLEAVLARLDQPEPAAAPTPDIEDHETVQLLPAPLRALIGRPMRDLNWIDRSPDLSVVELSTMEASGAAMRLMRGRPGVVLPPHDHSGTELTLVLAGGLIDENGALHRGDLQAMGPGEVHRPVVDEKDGCTVLFAADGEIIPVSESP